VTDVKIILGSSNYTVPRTRTKLGDRA